VKVPEALLPALSVAEQETVVVPKGNIEPDNGAQVTGTDPSTTLDAEAANVTIAPAGPVAFTVMSPGSVRTGGVLFSTVTVKEPVAVLPALSDAEQDTVVVPNGNVEPEAGLQVTSTDPSIRSEAEGEKVTAAPPGPVPCMVMSDGSCRVGGVRSTTVTLKEPEPVLPALSVTEQVTVVEPKANVEPDAGEQFGASGPSTLSTAETVKLAIAPAGPVASRVMSPGTVTTGGVLSWTVTEKVPLKALPALSFAEQETVLLPNGNIEPEAGVQENVLTPESESEALAS